MTSASGRFGLRHASDKKPVLRRRPARQNRYTVNGEPLVPERVYRVVSHDYVAGQWDKYLGFKPFDVSDTGELILDAIIRQVDKQYGLREAEGWD